ncbi:caspase family protein [Azotobacter beijerinckii]|uniref:Caspase domain-containing protein n=1 Tax=Azotobacter beijerinckii TaxID=170623 RepID=A0A1I4D1D4_9GAMM|nr:caspase family protein [Azotobacter beijerinckii]SFB28648.1 Caspase domain-containing protein [Azotobacter beijerinckii]SFK86670.1 Caspase domain-containing protein [Azotobacter beijerinckii]
MAKNALCIGINDYPGTGSDLSGCINDAHDWAAALKNFGFGVSTLFDEQATREAMVGAIGNLIGSAKSGDSVVLTYSGHGTWVEDRDGDEPDARDEALCPWDLTSAGPLLDDDIRGLFDARAAGVRLLLISDSCHSGSVTRGDERDLDAEGPRARFLPPAAWMKPGSLPAAPRASALTLAGGLRRVGGDLLLAGCRDDEYSWDTRFAGRPNGAFTFYALKTLKQDRPQTYEQWFASIRRYLPSTRLPQEPQLFGTRSARQMRIFD